MRLLVFMIVLVMALPSFAEEGRHDTNVLESMLDLALSPLEVVMGRTKELERIVVTPSRVGEKLGSASTSITVIDSADIKRKKLDTAKEALTDEVGIDVSETGAFQGQTYLLVRGGKPSHTLVMVDGMKAYDPISPSGEYNIAHLTLDNVDSIEILRGAQSALYGSDAMSGVVSVSSKRAEDTYANATFESGSFFTYTEKFEIGSAVKGLHYSVAGSRLDTKGISQAEAKSNCRERDPYDRTSIAARIDYDLTDEISFLSTVRHTESVSSIDQGANADDDNAVSSVKETFTTLGADQKVFEWWSHSVKLGWMETMRQYFDDDSPGLDFDRSKYFGKYFKLDYQSVFDIKEIDKIVTGYEFTEEMAEFFSQNDFSGPMAQDVMPKVFSTEGSAYLENRFNFRDRITSTQGLRVSHHSRAGTHLTYRIDASYLFFTGTKVRALMATGFKAPSLYQLYAPASVWFGGGNTSLQPEKSFSYEYGLDQYLLGDKVICQTTYFHTVYTNLIDALTNPNTWVTAQYMNIGKSQVHGIEASLKITPIEGVKTIFGYTFQNTTDFQHDQQMTRRPDNKFFAEFFWQATEKLSIDTMIRYNGPMSDNISNPAWGLNTYKLKEFVVVDANINYDINTNISIYLKAKNLFNKRYQEARGYGAPPFALYGGIKCTF